MSLMMVQRWTLDDLAEIVGGEVRGDGSARPTGVSTDTRTLQQGELFVALVGDRFDGHDYVEAACEGGACGAIVGRSVGDELAQIVVDDTLLALQQLGSAVFDALRESGARSVALTGSNGKTTTKELIAALWSTVANVHATSGNLNNHIGVPLTLCAAPDDVEMLVVEMGANHVGEIAALTGIAPADVRVVTSIGHAHIEGFGGLDGVRRGKSEIFEQSRPETVAVVPVAERDALHLDDFAGEILTVGPHDSGADVEYQQLSNGRVSLTGREFEYDLRFRLPGAHNAHNLATALATMVATDDLPRHARAQEALGALTLPGGRWRELERGGWRFLDDAYNANPSSVRASYDAFAEIVSADGEVDRGDVVAVLGEMLELGPDAAALHRETAEWVARRGGADAFVFVGRFAGEMAESARGTTDADVVAFDEPVEVARWLSTRRPGVAYLKASRGQKLERIIEELPG